MIESVRVFGWAKTRIAAQAGMGAVLGERIYRDDDVPENVPMPYVVMSAGVQGEDTLVFEGVRIWANPLLTVKAVGKRLEYATLVQIADAIDAALSPVIMAAPAGGIQVLSSVRDHAFSYPDPDREFVHVGGVYRMQVTAV